MVGASSDRWGRREFLRGLMLGGAAGLFGLDPTGVVNNLLTPQRIAAAEPPPETTRLRLVQSPSICLSPQFVAEPFLQREGFTDIQYVKVEGPAGISRALVSGQADISMEFSAPVSIRVDAGDPLVMLAGVHVGCFELFGTDRVRTVHDLKGKTVAMVDLGGSQHVFIASILAYVGLDPRKDVNFVPQAPAESMRQLAEGKIDAFLAFPPQGQELRAKKIGHALINSMMDRPWSQYFCCLVTGSRAFVQRYPVATKRALRAILNGADLCVRDPARVALFLLGKGLTSNYGYTLQALREIPYGKWREFDPEDTVRFYALRLREAGMIKNSPQKIIAQGTNWRFLNELKKEMKE